jgi:hypothetical protein
VVSSFQEKAEARVRFFEKMFKSPTRCPIQEILEVVLKFLVFLIEEMNKSLEEEVTKVDISASLSSMKNGKSLVQDRFTVEFFKCFYDFLKEDLLLIVRESQRNGKVLGSFNSTFLCLIPPPKKMVSLLRTLDPFPATM